MVAQARRHSSAQTIGMHFFLEGLSHLRDPSWSSAGFRRAAVGPLADFYQSDGIIIGKDLTLANLFDTLLKIYADIGVRIKFVPAYYPFVEPGVHVLVEINKEWMEIGGAGIIRREITGVERKTISVLAWGLAIERLLLVKDRKIKSISSLYNSNVGWLRERDMR